MLSVLWSKAIDETGKGERREDFSVESNRERKLR